MIRTTPFTLISLLLIATGCQQMGYSDRPQPSGSDSAARRDLRDLRQHTFADDDRTRYLGPNLTPDQSTLLFTLYKKEGRTSYQTDIYSKPVNGKAKSQRTFNGEDDWSGSVSPDGSKIAYVTTRNGTADIFVMNLAGGRAKRQITSGEQTDIAPSWSHDGSKIAFSRYSESAKEWDIWTFDLLTGSLTSLVPGLYPRYSPVDDTLLFQRWDSTLGHYALWTVDSGAFNESEIAASGTASFVTPRWSPDGKKIVFCSGGNLIAKSRTKSFYSKRVTFGSAEDEWKFRANDIWVVDRDGSGRTQLTDTEEGEFSPFWGSDGRIYFSLDRDGAVNIWSALPDTVEVSATVETIE